MSAGSFSLMPGPPTPGITPANFAGGITPGVVAGFTSVTLLYQDVAALVKQCPVGVVQAAYMRSCRELCRRSQWLRRNIPIVALTPTVAAYNFGNDPALEVIDVPAASVQQLPPSNNFVNLHSTDQKTFDPNQQNDIPNWYSYLPEGMICFYPTPNLAYNVKLELIVQTLKYDSGGVLVPNDLLNKFNTYIEAGAKAFLYSMDKEPWANPLLQKDNENEFEAGVATAKSLKDKGNQSGAVRATPRPFIAR